MSSNEQILLEELKQIFPNFTCTLQDLRTPTEEFVTNFYTYWLSEFEVNITSIPQTQFSQQTSSVSTHHDAYSSTIPKLNLLLAIRAFNVVHDFGMLDIVAPTPKRIQTVIRAFCEFFQWCDLRIGTMIDIKKEKKISERKQQLASMVQEKQNLQTEKNNILKTIGQLQDTKKELEEELSKNTQVAVVLRMEKDLLKTQSEEANVKKREREAIISKIVKEDSQVTNKIKDYSNQIVNSPTMILSDLETLRSKNEEMKSLSEQKRDMVEAKMKAQESLQKVLGSLEEKSGQLDEVLKVIEHKRKLLQIVSEIEKGILGRQEELKELKSSLLSIINKKNCRQEQLQTLNLKYKSTLDQFTQSIEAAKSELRKQKSAKSKMIDSLKEDATVEKNLSLIIENIEIHVKAFQNEYEEILQGQNVFYEGLQSIGLRKKEHLMKEVQKLRENRKKNQSSKE